MLGTFDERRVCRRFMQHFRRVSCWALGIKFRRIFLNLFSRLFFEWYCTVLSSISRLLATDRKEWWDFPVVSILAMRRIIARVTLLAEVSVRAGAKVQGPCGPLESRTPQDSGRGHLHSYTKINENERALSAWRNEGESFVLQMSHRYITCVIAQAHSPVQFCPKSVPAPGKDV